MRSKSTSLAFALAIGFCTAACTYAIMRMVQARFFPAPDPRTVVNVTKIAFFYRSQIAGYAGLLAAFGGYALHPRAPGAFDRLLPTMGLVTAAIVVGQGLLVP